MEARDKNLVGILFKQQRTVKLSENTSMFNSQTYLYQ